MKKYKRRLVTITREDLTSGYQTVQSAHAVADYAMKNPFKFLRWRLTSGYLISLATTDKDSLEGLCQALDNLGVKHVKFYEYDIEEVTAISFVSTELTDILTSRLPLANRNVGSIDKNINIPPGCSSVTTLN